MIKEARERPLFYFVDCFMYWFYTYKYGFIRSWNGWEL